MQPSRFYYPQIDGLRFLAFLMVFFSHFYDVHTYFANHSLLRHILWPFMERGWTGVDIFLVLSSFLIFSLLLVERDRNGSVEVRNFYIRRALRIWPVYFPYLIFAMVIWPWIAGSGGSPSYYTTLKQQLFPFLTFGGNLSYIYFESSIKFAFGHLWTVCLEEQFYIWPPIIMALFVLRSTKAFWLSAAGLLVFTSLCKVYFVMNGIGFPMLWTAPWCRMDPFIIGAGIAVIFHEKPKWLEWPIGWLFLLSAGAGFALICAGGQMGASLDPAWEIPLSDICAALLLLSTLTPWGVDWIFKWRPIAYLGKISFGLYVYHEIPLRFMYAGYGFAKKIGGGPLGYTADFLLALGATIAVSSISYIFYERPILKFKERFAVVRSRPA